jgi:hypothetical protein
LSRQGSRRKLFKIAAALGVGAVLAPACTGPAVGFTHPGLLHTRADFARMKAKVEAGAQPWKAGWDALVGNAHAQADWKPKPVATVVRGGTGENYSRLFHDIAAAYQNALRFKISDEPAHGDTARDILHAWSGTLTSISGTSDRYLGAGLYGYQFANVAEILRDYPGFDLAAFTAMMRNVFAPLNEEFLAHHNGQCITHYWANWDLCNLASVLAIGILCEDRSTVDRAVNYATGGAGNGSINHAIPFVYGDDGLAQWQESGRDQGHTVLGIGLLGSICQMAWNQGIDLFSAAGDRFRLACEYVAKYNLGQDVPFTPYTWGGGPRCAQDFHAHISAGGRGEARAVWELVYNHYAVRQRASMPYTATMAAKVRPEGGGGNYGNTSGGFDTLGFGTLTFTL